MFRKTGLLNAMKFAGQVELLFSIAWLEYLGWLNGIYFDIGWDIILHGVLLSMAGWNSILALLLDGMTLTDTECNFDGSICPSMTGMDYLA